MNCAKNYFRNLKFSTLRSRFRSRSLGRRAAVAENSLTCRRFHTSEFFHGQQKEQNKNSKVPNWYQLVATIVSGLALKPQDLFYFVNALFPFSSFSPMQNLVLLRLLPLWYETTWKVLGIHRHLRILNYTHFLILYRH